MSLFETITRLIDNEKVLLNEFIIAAQHYQDYQNSELAFADFLQEWFVDYLEREDTLKVELCRGIEQYRQPIAQLFKSILSSAINNISCEDWRSLAHHYLTKAAEA